MYTTVDQYNYPVGHLLSTVPNGRTNMPPYVVPNDPTWMATQLHLAIEFLVIHVSLFSRINLCTQWLCSVGLIAAAADL